MVKITIAVAILLVCLITAVGIAFLIWKALQPKVQDQTKNNSNNLNAEK